MLFFLTPIKYLNYKSINTIRQNEIEEDSNTHSIDHRDDDPDNRISKFSLISSFSSI